MKGTKKLLTLVVALFVVFALTGCSFLSPLGSKLEAPVASLNSNQLVWNEVENAKYEVVITYSDGTQETFEVSENNYTISFEKEGSVKVRCIVDGKYSDYSNSVEIKKPEVTQLSKPRNLKKEGNSVSWDKVDYATSYEVTINGEVFVVTDNKIVVSDSNKNVLIEVKAISDVFLDSPRTYLELNNAAKASKEYVESNIRTLATSLNVNSSDLANLLVMNNCSKEDVVFFGYVASQIQYGDFSTLSLPSGVSITNISGAIYDFVKAQVILLNDETLTNLVNSISKEEFVALATQVVCDLNGALSAIEQFVITLPREFTLLVQTMLQGKDAYSKKIATLKAGFDSFADNVKTYISSLSDYEVVLDKVLVVLASELEKYTGLQFDFTAIDLSEAIEKAYFLLDYLKSFEEADISYVAKKFATLATAQSEELVAENSTKVILYLMLDFVEYLDTNNFNLDINVEVSGEQIYAILAKCVDVEVLNQLEVTPQTLNDLLNTLKSIYEKYSVDIDLSQYYSNKTKKVDEIYAFLMQENPTLPKITEQQKQDILKIDPKDFVKLLENDIVRNVILLSFASSDINVSRDYYDKYVNILAKESPLIYRECVEALITAHNASIDYDLYEKIKKSFAMSSIPYDLYYSACAVVSKTVGQLESQTNVPMVQVLLQTELVKNILVDFGGLTLDDVDAFTSQSLEAYIRVISLVNEISSYPTLNSSCRAAIDELMNTLHELF